MRLLLIATCLFFLLSCKKSGGDRACWQIVDFSGNPVTTICNKTETELVECVTSGNCGYGGSTGFSSCNYYKLGGEKYCWQIGTTYLNDATESYAQLVARCYAGGATPVKIDCSRSCYRWYHREKRTLKRNNSITYSPTKLELFCGDTAATLYQGRQVILKNDADSLNVRQFSNNGTSW